MHRLAVQHGTWFQFTDLDHEDLIRANHREHRRHADGLDGCRNLATGCGSFPGNAMGADHFREGTRE